MDQSPLVYFQTIIKVSIDSLLYDKIDLRKSATVEIFSAGRGERQEFLILDTAAEGGGEAEDVT